VVFKQEAKKAGLELKLELIDSASSFKKMMEKKHQIAFGNWSTGVVPSYWSMWHSENAHKPQTVNITNMDDPLLDKLIIRYRDSVPKQERVKLGLDIQQIIHNKSVFIPTLKGNMNREAYWRWMKYPENLGTSRTAALLAPIPWTDWTFWIDVAGKQATKDALSNGDIFEPVTIIDTTYKAVQ
jgi:microcin C transport system substrate-binding protein